MGSHLPRGGAASSSGKRTHTYAPSAIGSSSGSQGPETWVLGEFFLNFWGGGWERILAQSEGLMSETSEGLMSENQGQDLA
jgi:hypothetical protein